MSEIQNEEGTTETNYATIEQFTAGEAELSALSPEDQDRLLNGEDEPQDGETAEFIETSPDLEVSETAKPETIEENSTSEQPKAEDTKGDEPEDPLADLKRKHYEKSNELNTFVQNQRNHESRLKNDPVYRAEWLKSLGVAQENAALAKTEDVYSEEHLRKIDTLEAKIAELTQSLTARDQETQRNQQLDNTFREIELIQAETPMLKTQKNVRELNDLFAKAHGANNGNVTAATMADYGVSADDFERLQVILEINQKKSNEGYPTLRSAFRDSLHFDNLQQRAVSAVAAKSQEALAGKLQEVGNQPTTVDTTSGVAGEQGRWTDESLREYFLSNPDPSTFSTKEQRDIYDSAMRAAGIS